MLNSALCYKFYTSVIDFQTSESHRNWFMKVNETPDSTNKLIQGTSIIILSLMVGSGGLQLSVFA